MRRFTIARFTRSTIIASTALTLGAAGCGDDKTDPPATDTTVNDTSTTDTETPQEDVAGDTTAENDVVETNPCDPNPCTVAPGPKCDGNAVVTSAGPGTCTEVDGAASCAYTETSTACDGTDVCSAGACVAAGNACEYEFDARVSYVTEIKVVDSKDCCFDFDSSSPRGDTDVDNALGDLLSPTSTLGGVLAGLGFDINATIAEQIDSGSLVLLLETKGLENLTTETDVTINGFYGADADEDVTNNATGMSSFVAFQNAFVAGTQSPYISFTDGTVTSGVLAAGPSLFNLNIPLLGANLALAVEATSFEAEIAEGAMGAEGGVSMGGTDGAKLGGYIAVETVAEAFNTYLNASCSCVSKKAGREADPYVNVKVNENAAGGPMAQLDINIDGGANCTAEGEDTCKSVGDNMKTYGGIAASAIKPDVARDGLYRDAISVGVRIKAVSASVTGVDGCEAAAE